MNGPEEATRESAWPETALWPRFRGIMDEFGDKVSWESFTETLLLPSPINTPAEQQRRAYNREQRQI